MTPPTRRAQNRPTSRWRQNGEASWLLKDGSVIKALITGGPGAYVWTTYTRPVIVGTAIFLADAQRAARKALREVGDGHDNH